MLVIFGVQSLVYIYHDGTLRDKARINLHVCSMWIDHKPWVKWCTLTISLWKWNKSCLREGRTQSIALSRKPMYFLTNFLKASYFFNFNILVRLIDLYFMVNLRTFKQGQFFKFLVLSSRKFIKSKSLLFIYC